MENHLFLTRLFFYDRDKNDDVISFERDEMGTSADDCVSVTHIECNRFPRGILPSLFSISLRIRQRIGGIICGVSTRLRGPIRDISQSALGCAES